MSARYHPSGPNPCLGPDGGTMVGSDRVEIEFTAFGEFQRICAL